nr:hypothetical protein [Tanacetum cinerariifolium]
MVLVVSLSLFFCHGVEGGLGSAVVAMSEPYFFVGYGSEGRRGIVEMIVSVMVSNTSGEGVPVKNVFQNRLLDLFNQEVGEDLSRVREYRGVVFRLNIAMRRRKDCIRELKALGDREDIVETMRFMEKFQQDDMEKRDRSLLLMREMEVNAREKS